MTKAKKDQGLVFAELSTDEYLAMLDAYVRTMLGHPAVDAAAKPKAKTPVRVDRRKKKV